MTLVVGLGGAMFALGLLLLMFPPDEPRRAPRPRPGRRQLGVDAVVGGAAGALLLAVLRWPVAAAAGGLLAAQAVAGAREVRAERRALARREALADAAARLRDASGAGLGLLEAIELAAKTAGEPLQAELQALNSTARTNGPKAAFERWGKSTRDPLVRVFAATIEEAHRAGSGQKDLFGAFATAAAKEARTARETAARAGIHRISATLIAGLGVAFLLYIRVFGGEAYAGAYDDVVGQVAMAIGFAPIAFGYVALLRAGRVRPGLAWGTEAAPTAAAGGPP